MENERTPMTQIMTFRMYHTRDTQYLTSFKERQNALLEKRKKIKNLRENLNYERILIYIFYIQSK